MANPDLPSNVTSSKGTLTKKKMLESYLSLEKLNEFYSSVVKQSSPTVGYMGLPQNVTLEEWGKYLDDMGIKWELIPETIFKLEIGQYANAKTKKTSKRANSKRN